uniref:Intraflagellar transport protein 80 homolog n=1 Tax=Romanomermis culicivorax TaxID=13658 RepID=A0A915HIV4_ROMCU
MCHDFVCAVSWISADETISCGDNQKLSKYNVKNDQWTEIAKLPEDLYPTNLHYNPKGFQKESAQVSEILALASTNGKIYLIQKNGRVEKSVEAHKGAVLCVRWNYDGVLLTTGEDGALKIWSRNGMLRSQLAQNSGAVYGAAWSPDNSRIVFVCGPFLFMKALQVANAGASKINHQWKGHDGVILGVDWNSSNDLIITGGEDKKFRIWDSDGQNLFASAVHENPITTISWSWDGRLFGVGSFDTLKLCDQAGWTHSIAKPNAGSFFCLAWSPDGSQIAAATSTGGHMIFHLTENVKNWTTPIILDTKDPLASLIAMSQKYLVLCDFRQLTIHSYDGKLVCSPKINLSRWDFLSNYTTAISNDFLAICDKMNAKIIHLIEIPSGKLVNKIAHSQDIIQIDMDQFGTANDRILAFIDKNGDLFLSYCRQTASLKSPAKISKTQFLANMIHSIAFNLTTNMLAGLKENQLYIWTYPKTVYIDKDLLPKATMVINSEYVNFYFRNYSLNLQLVCLLRDIRQRTLIENFDASFVVLTRQDGSKINYSVTPFVVTLLIYLDKEKWDEALKLCRRTKDEILWATLAAASLHAGNTNNAEIAYTNLSQHEKVYFISSLRLANQDIKMAELSALCGNMNDAENSFLQKNQIVRAIMLNISLHRWERALDLAEKYNAHLDTVCVYRQKFLDDTNRKENDKRFLRLYSETLLAKR